MKKIAICILLILFGLAVYTPTAAYASSNSANRAASKNEKRAAKRNAKQRKRDRKQSQKATKDWKKRHRTGF